MIKLEELVTDYGTRCDGHQTAVRKDRLAIPDDGGT